MENNNYSDIWKRIKNDLSKVVDFFSEKLSSKNISVQNRRETLRDLGNQLGETPDASEKISIRDSIGYEQSAATIESSALAQISKAIEDPFFLRIVTSKGLNRSAYYISEHISEPSIGLVSYTAPFAALRFYEVGEINNAYKILEKEDIKARRKDLLWIRHTSQAQNFVCDGKNIQKFEISAAHKPVDIEVLKDNAKIAIDTMNKSANVMLEPDKSPQYVLGEITREMRKEQDEIMRAPANGVLLIEGSAGSGKTNIAFHRLDYLIKEQLIPPEMMVAFCYNVSLRKYLESVRKDLGLQAVHIYSIDSWLNQLVVKATAFKVEYHDNVYDGLLRSKEIIDILERFVRHNQEAGLRDPINAKNFLDKFYISDCFRKYALSVGQPIEGASSLSQRKSVSGAEAAVLAWWLVTKEKWAWLVTSGLWMSDKEWREKKKGDHGIRIFKHILVDEVQDFTPIQMAVLNCMHDNSMTIVGDITQVIYGQELKSWDDLGIQIDNEMMLKTSHRSSLETTLFANAIASSISSSVSANKVSKRGLLPKVFIEKDHVSALGRAVSIIKELKSCDPRASIVVAFPSNKFVTDSLPIFKSSRIDAYVAKGDTWNFSNKVHLTTYQQLKGLEFDHVIVIGLNDFERWHTFKNKNQIVYTTITRARKRVYIIAESDLPKFFDGIDQELYEKIQ
jgi:DNA helicase IV